MCCIDMLPASIVLLELRLSPTAKHSGGVGALGGVFQIGGGGA